MKQLYTITFALAATFSHAQVTFFTLNDISFSPESATIQLGETVTFEVTGAHTATQVSEDTWNASGSTMLPGGFHFTAGTHEYTPTEAGTIYFVCQPHAGMGMKGMLIVETDTQVEETGGNEAFNIYPNPVQNELNVSADVNGAQLQLIDMQGRVVLSRQVSSNDKLDLSQLKEGNYTAILRGNDGNTIATKRLTIAR